MKRILLTFLVPPVAVCRYGCAGCCAAPIGVMWIAGIVGIIYGFAGGPADTDTVSWATVGLGILLWMIAVVWGVTVVRGVNDDKADPKCQQKRSTLCSIVKSDDDSDPMSDIKNLTR
ncbi:MAG: hypothetical protein PVG20_02440 [Thioalkalispiraceae bacterium]|jgi:hypothetical protein